MVLSARIWRIQAILGKWQIQDEPVIGGAATDLVLAKPENWQRLPFFAGIERVRYHRPVHPGDVVIIEANVVRLRRRMGLLKGVARVNGRSVLDGTMTFALGKQISSEEPSADET